MCGLCTLSPAAKDRMKKRNNLISVWCITVAMGVIESNDKVVLAITATSITFVVAYNVFVEQVQDAGLISAWVSAGAIVLAVGGLILRGKVLSGKIEAMEVTAARYVAYMRSEGRHSFEHSHGADVSNTFLPQASLYLTPVPAAHCPAPTPFIQLQL